MSRKQLSNRLVRLERANQPNTQRFRGVLIIPYSVAQKGPKTIAVWMRDHGFQSPVMLPDARPKGNA
jgi:hypothetical protein